MEGIILTGLFTSIFAGAKAHAYRMDKSMVKANVVGVIGIAGYIVAVGLMYASGHI